MKSLRTYCFLVLTFVCMLGIAKENSTPGEVKPELSIRKSVKTFEVGGLAACTAESDGDALSTFEEFEELCSAKQNKKDEKPKSSLNLLWPSAQ